LKIQRLLISAGILIIISSIFAFWLGYSAIFFVWGFGFDQVVNPVGLTFMGIFNLLGSAFGLISGYYMLKRKNLAISVIGAGWVMVGGIIVAPFFDGSWLRLGVPMVILAILSIVFVTAAGRNFSR
jgi:hypothetical protein